MNSPDDDPLLPALDSAQQDEPAKRRRGVPWLGVTLFLLLGAFVVGSLISAVGTARDAAARAWCTCKGGGQLSMALLNYADAHGSFPPAYIADASGKPIHSWRALILPYLNSELAARYDFDEPWDGPNNSKLLGEMPGSFRCVSDIDAPAGTTNYVAVVGEETMWPGSVGRKFSDARDGTPNTILIVEATGLNIPWLEPRDLTFDTMDFQINGKSGPSISSHHRGGAMTWAADCGRKWLPDKTPPETVRALLTAAGGERIEFP